MDETTVIKRLPRLPGHTPTVDEPQADNDARLPVGVACLGVKSGRWSTKVAPHD